MNDKVKDYLPYFPFMMILISANVTIRDLLSHRVDWGLSGDVIWYKSEADAEELICGRAKYRKLMTSGPVMVIPI